MHSFTAGHSRLTKRCRKKFYRAKNSYGVKVRPIANVRNIQTRHKAPVILKTAEKGEVVVLKPEVNCREKKNCQSKLICSSLNSEINKLGHMMGFNIILTTFSLIWFSCDVMSLK